MNGKKKRWRAGGSLISLKYAAVCDKCGRFLERGTRARFYNSRRIYCAPGDHLFEQALRLPEPEQTIDDIPQMRLSSA